MFARLVAVAAGSAVTLMAQQFVELRDRHLQRYTTDRLEAADVDGDGDLDLLARDGALHENDGHGVFLLHLPGTFIPLVAGALGYRVRDIDGDGLPDLLATTATARVVRHGVPGGGFEPTPWSIPGTNDAALDFDADGDGDLDVLDSRFRLFRNDGRGTWTDVSAGIPSPAPAGYPNGAADLDRDGDLDLLFGGLTLWENLGACAFRDRSAGLPLSPYLTGPITVADADRDGLPDLICFALVPSRAMAIHWRNAGSFQFVDVSDGTFPEEFDLDRLWTAVPSDADRDGAVDFWCPGLGLMRNSGVGTFALDASTPIPPGRLAIADVDVDGDQDLLVDGLRLFFNDGRGRLSEERAPASSAFANTQFGSWYVRTADLDGDGDEDVAGTWQFIALNDGHGSLTPLPPSRMPPVPANAMVVGLADVTSDQRPDLFLFGGTRGLTLWSNDGRGGFRDDAGLIPRFVPQPNVPTLVFGDVDRDGDTDAVTAYGYLTTGGLFTLLRNDGAAGFTLLPLIPPAIGFVHSPVALVDLDSDGDLDLLAVHMSVGPAVFLNDGTGAFPTAVNGDVPGDRASCVDWDHDGDLDVVCRSRPLSGQVPEFQVLVNDGRGGLRARTLAAASPGITLDEFWLADVDDDGDLDLGGARGPDGPGWFANDGAGNFTLAPGLRSDGIAVRGRVADLDGDGDPDFVDATRIALNRHRQIEAPWVARLGHPVRFELNAAPGYGSGPRAAAILLGTAMLPRPVPLGTLGNLRVDLASAHAIGPSPLPAGGSTLLDLMIPRDPALVGATLVAQGLVLDGLLPSNWRLTGVASRTIRR
ncbi:MAG: VCBS repeat-containing protein [Planctomycetes bacterium]|nr:VCBS repeat-containing protein [Planctomycetota bacterium]